MFYSREGDAGTPRLVSKINPRTKRLAVKTIDTQIIEVATATENRNLMYGINSGSIIGSYCNMSVPHRLS